MPVAVSGTAVGKSVLSRWRPSQMRFTFAAYNTRVLCFCVFRRRQGHGIHDDQPGFIRENVLSFHGFEGCGGRAIGGQQTTIRLRVEAAVLLKLRPLRDRLPKIMSSDTQGPFALATCSRMRLSMSCSNTNCLEIILQHGLTFVFVGVDTYFHRPDDIHPAERPGPRTDATTLPPWWRIPTSPS